MNKTAARELYAALEEAEAEIYRIAMHVEDNEELLKVALDIKKNLKNFKNLALGLGAAGVLGLGGGAAVEQMKAAPDSIITPQVEQQMRENKFDTPDMAALMVKGKYFTQAQVSKMSESDIRRSFKDFLAKIHPQKDTSGQSRLNQFHGTTYFEDGRVETR